MILNHNVLPLFFPVPLHRLRDCPVDKGVQAFPLGLCGGSFFCPRTKERGRCLMVTYSELFMFCDLVIGIISLVILITKKK